MQDNSIIQCEPNYFKNSSIITIPATIMESQTWPFRFRRFFISCCGWIASKKTICGPRQMLKTATQKIMHIFKSISTTEFARKLRSLSSISRNSLFISLHQLLRHIRCSQSRTSTWHACIRVFSIAHSLFQRRMIYKCVVQRRKWLYSLWTSNLLIIF